MNKTQRNMVTKVLMLIALSVIFTPIYGFGIDRDNIKVATIDQAVISIIEDSTWNIEQISPLILDRLKTITKINPVDGIKYNNGDIFYIVIAYSSKSDAYKAFVELKKLLSKQSTVKHNNKYITVLSDKESSLAVMTTKKYFILLPLSSSMKNNQNTYFDMIFIESRISSIEDDIVGLNKPTIKSEKVDVVEKVYEIDLGLAYGGRVKTWELDIPEGFVKIETATYGENKDETNKYGGFNAYMKINGRYAWETVRYNPTTGEDGRNIIDYTISTSGTKEREPEGRGSYLDVTKHIKTGKNELTYAHFGGGGIGIKVKITVITSE